MPSNSAGKPSSSSSKSRGSSRTSRSSGGNNGAAALAWPALVPLGHHEGKPAIPLMRPVMLVGSRHNAHLHLLSRQISKAHALLINSDGKVYIRDLASRTHVYVNGQEVHEADLVDGDLIKLGSFTFRYQAAAGMKQKPVADTTPPGQIDVQGGDFPLQIDERVMLIGRRPSCDISLMEESCSTAHAVLFSMNGKRYVRDLGSRTGTFVNGAQVRQQEINFGDVVHIGDSDLRYESSAIGATTANVDELEDLVGTAPLMPEAAASTESAGETPLEMDFAEPAKPAKPIADAPIPMAMDEDHSAEPHTLIGANLIKEKLSSSATGMNMQDEARQAMELAKEDRPAMPPLRIARDEPAIPVEPEPAPMKIQPQVSEPEVPVAAEPELDLEPLTIEREVTEPQAPVAAEPELELEPLTIEPEVVEPAAPIATEPTLPPAKPSLFEHKPVVVEPITAEIEQSAAEPALPPVEEDLSLVEDLHILPHAAQTPTVVESDAESQQVAFDAGSLAFESEPTVSEPPTEHVEVQPVAQQVQPEPMIDIESTSGPVLDADTIASGIEPEIYFGDESIEEITENSKPAEEPLDLAPVADEPAPVEHEAAEVIEPTEPTNESALPLEAVEPAPAAEPELTTVAPVMSDTAFGRQVAEFTAGSPDPIVEQPVEAIEPQVAGEIPEPAPLEAEPVAAEAVDVAEIDFGDSVVGDEVEPATLSTATHDEGFATAHVTVPPDFAQDVDVVEDIAEPFTAVEQPLPVVETPVIVEQPPIEAAPELDVATPVEESAFEEAVDLEMSPQAPVVDEPTPVEELPLEEFPEALEGPYEPDEFEPLSQQPMVIPGLPLDLSQPAMMPEFVSGLPLVLNELPRVPSTFGRVQVSFNGAVGPQAVVDEPITRLKREPGPFDNLQIDIDNPVPDAAPLLQFGELEEIGEAPVAEEPQAAEPELVIEPEPMLDELPEVVEELPAPVQEEIAPPQELPPPVEAPIAAEPVVDEAPRRSLFSRKKRQKPAEAETPAAQPPAEEFAASGGAAFGEVPAGFEGLSAASSPGNVDIFSQGMVADLSTDPVFGAPVKLTADERKPRRKGFEPPPVDEVQAQAVEKLADDLGAPLLAELPTEPVEAEAPAVVEEPVIEAPTPRVARRAAPAQAEAAFVARPRRRKGRRVAVLLTVMIALMVASAWVIYTFLQSQMRFSGTLTYDNFGNLTAKQRSDLEASQKELLLKEITRQGALTEFTRHHPNAPAGYLGDRVDFARNEVRVRWDGATLVYRYDGSDKELDGERVKAVLVAIKNLDTAMVADAARLEKQVHEFETQIAQKEQTLASLKAMRDKDNDLMTHQPDPQQLQALRADADTAEKAYRDAFDVAKQAGDELKKLELASIDANPAQAQNVATSDPAKDPELAELEKSLEAMKGRLSTARESVSDKADSARKKLDTAIEQLQQSTAHAETLLKDNPELGTFVADAQKTQLAVQKLAGDLLDRQQKAYEKLLENKSLLEEHLAQRRKELWDSDKQIKRMKDDLAMRERGANAAREQGYEKEANDIQKELEASLQAVETRKAELEADPMITTLNDLLARCQQEITDATKTIEADRKQADLLAQDIQKNFAKLSPAVGKLPESQRAMAQEMSQKMQAVNNARKQAADAIEAKNPDANVALKTVEQNIKDLTLKIDERKKDLASLNEQRLPAAEMERRHQAAEQKRVAYAAAVKSKADAEANWLDKRKTLQHAEALADDAKAAKAEYDKSTTEYTNLAEKELPQLGESMKQAKQNLMTSAYPSDPKMLEPILLEDRRLPYTAFAIAGIALIFSLLIFFTGSGEPSYEPNRYAAPMPPVAAKQGLSLVKDEAVDSREGVESAAA